MREHLKKFFTASASHHVEMAKAHQFAMDGSDEGDSQHEFHKAAATSHMAAGETCVACAKACETSRKVDGGDELEPLPKGFSKTAPTPPNIRAVPRAGQQPLPTPEQNPMFTEVFGTQESE
jgi:hypothetical protein